MSFSAPEQIAIACSHKSLFCIFIAVRARTWIYAWSNKTQNNYENYWYIFIFFYFSLLAFVAEWPGNLFNLDRYLFMQIEVNFWTFTNILVNCMMNNGQIIRILCLA